MTIPSIISTLFLTTAAISPDDAMLKPLITKQEIAYKISEVASQIRADYKDKDLVILMVMKGSVCLAADLMREIDLPLDLQSVQCSSYGANGTSRGELIVFGLDRLNIKDRDVLIVDDIFDTGHTIAFLIEELKKLSPRSIKSCVLLNKNDVEKATSYRPEYVLFDIENYFVVGYGLDYKEQYRGLAGVYVLEER